MDRTVVITGGTGALGRAVVAAFVEDGWHVVVLDLRPAELEGAEVVEANLTDAADVARAVGAAGPSLRAVVNLVGGFAAGQPVADTPVEVFEAQFALNLRPTYLVTQAALPALAAAGGGAIVCVSSRAALKPFAGAAGYVVAKAAVLAFVDVLAVEYRDDGIRANAILPSVIDTPANRRSMPNADHARWVAPEQVAAVVRLLCEDGSQIVSGAHVPVYGRA
jgi:NAD(P)-dependent dehydrogenase (short-subunit alcohol dehydrogenase family)